MRKTNELTMPRRRPVPSAPGTSVITGRGVGVLPLDYLLELLNDPNADPRRRDWAAKVAVAFVHRKLADTPVGKKAQRAEAARHAGVGTPWGDDLKQQH